tara:strand:- start:1355 stop:1561 length:207 start_codon:yes stop_codon:yes gene_type:complete
MVKIKNNTSFKLQFFVLNIFLLLTIPWAINLTTIVFGLPLWAFYSFVMTILYSLILVFFFANNLENKK